jgi:RNA polymerase sigma-70 factor, ECF subfamily
MAAAPGGSMDRAFMQDATSDEALLAELASGRQDAIGALYARYAPTVLGMAAQALGRPAAEEIVQDVFLAVWKGAGTFDPTRGAVRPWLLQIAHYRIANELRRRSRRPRLQEDPDGERMGAVPDPGLSPSDEVWSSYRHAALRRALEELPPPQRQALGLAFYEQLSHDEIAEALRLPLGTAKSRIRAGLKTLRARLAPILAAVAVAAAAGLVVLRLGAGGSELARDERALTMLTSSDARSVRLTAPGNPDSAAHGVYRYRPGAPVAVFTISRFEPAPPGRVYRAWVRARGEWLPLATLRLDAAGHARAIGEQPAFASAPDRVEVTIEAASGGAAPAGPVVVAWP